MKLLDALTRPTTEMLPVTDDPEFRAAFATLRTAEAAHRAARIEAGRYPTEQITLACLAARENHARAEAAELAARQTLEAIHARKQANIIAAFEPQVQAALRTFYQHLVQEVRPLAEAVRDVQVERNRLLDGGGVELPNLVRAMVGGSGACGEESLLAIESAPFLGGN